jgi:hypothetical protein
METCSIASKRSGRTRILQAEPKRPPEEAAGAPKVVVEAPKAGRAAVLF